MKYVIGIGGVTKRGKTTLTNRLIKNLPKCCVVHQDDFFKPRDQIEFLLCSLYFKYSLSEMFVFDRSLEEILYCSN
uniref:Muscle-specific beta 1 integrin binding protein 2 n=1 Tax=Stegastes partitus TaxID=144197 RepID=A0A3B5ARR6_9TELE